MNGDMNINNGNGFSLDKKAHIGADGPTERLCTKPSRKTNQTKLYETQVVGVHTIIFYIGFYTIYSSFQTVCWSK
ncbi:hypothetical protein RSOLAG1IB_06490 [Rhizoctonia solani AG-1 IB]|uniref:Uncharacterized protein n=1 Tax=Thanatephorus cucumeris (strain AG1-IB / isolate 7/3/14) TaxID=1108050 RepID=A0A0B7F7X3_THACB|nr:hypothetical protein RSOLAG1IB_06490 [Rhizoctonia solani AG-1 IB]